MGKEPTLAGPGSIWVEGGCVVPMRLELALVPRGGDVEVRLDSTWRAERQGRVLPRRATGRVDAARLAAALAGLQPLVRAPPSPPSLSTGALRAQVALPMATPSQAEVLVVGLSESHGSPPLGPILAWAIDLAWIALERADSVEPWPETTPAPRAPLGRGALARVVASSRGALLLVAVWAAWVGLWMLLGALRRCG